MTENQKELFQDVLNNWGEKNQMEMVVEECSELILAIQKFKRNPSVEAAEQIRQEVADVGIMVDQMTIVLGEEHVNHYRAVKLARLRERLQVWKDNGSVKTGNTL